MTDRSTASTRKVEPWPGAASIRARIPPGWYTRQMLAEKVGRTKDTIERWERADPPVIKPDGYMEFGQLTVWLYSEEAAEEIRRMTNARKPGRKKEGEP